VASKLWGLAGLVTLAGFVVGGAATLDVRYRAMLIFSGVLIFGWVSLIEHRYRE
jgi:hypothetical protein